MAKIAIKHNPIVTTIFDDLEKFYEFCRTYGYRFDEKNLYDMRNYAYQQYSKSVAGKNFKDMWGEDARRLGLMI